MVVVCAYYSEWKNKDEFKKKKKLIKLTTDYSSII